MLTLGCGLLAPALIAAFSSVAPASALTLPPVFGVPINLGASGGEPSLLDDGRNHVFVASPNGLGSTNSGSTVWRSTDGGTTFDTGKKVGGLIGGGDSDILADPAGNLWITDLAGTHANVLKSTDSGATWGGAVMTGFLNDRQWLTWAGSAVYLTYHDFVTNAPEIYKSTDGGATFLPAGFAGTSQIVPPTDPAFADSKCNTLVSKPVVDGAGAIYVLINTTTAAANAQGGCAAPPAALERFYIAVSTDGGTTFATHLASDLTPAVTGNATSGSWGHVFNQLAIDAAGNLYIDASGTLDGSLPLQNYLLVSTDKGVTWSKPIATHASPDAQLFPAIAVGQAGQVAVGYYQGSKPDHHAAASNYQFAIDQTFGATGAAPAFTHSVLPLKPGTTTVHPDGICTDGIFCGTPASGGGNRNLADFESMAVDPAGHIEVIIPADADGTNTENWFYRQLAGPLMPPGKINGNGTGNQTWLVSSSTTTTTTSSSSSQSSTSSSSAAAVALPNTGASLPPAGVVAGLIALTTGGLVAAGRRRRRTLS
ncbi:MAG TPA: sialidase family protein [Candidatus Dormibacteraeota bacterium]|nr:sialidase family protein [Candidatus Dormibacteraeota bacterium]